MLYSVPTRQNIQPSQQYVPTPQQNAPTSTILYTECSPLSTKCSTLSSECSNLSTICSVHSTKFSILFMKAVKIFNPLNKSWNYSESAINANPKILFHHYLVSVLKSANWISFRHETTFNISHFQIVQWKHVFFIFFLSIEKIFIQCLWNISYNSS